MSKTLQRRGKASIRIPRQSQRRVGAPVLLGSKARAAASEGWGWRKALGSEHYEALSQGC